MGILSLRTVNRTKDKRSKAKNKSNDDQVPEVFTPLPEWHYYRLPFKKYSDQPNPFVMPSSKFNTPEKAHVYQLAIDSIVEFGSECADRMQWDFGDKIHIKKKISALNKQIKEITNQLKFLIPTEANSTRKTKILRMFEAFPGLLVEQVEMFKLKLEDYDLNQTKKSLKIKGNPRMGREKATKIFMEKTLRAKFQKIALTNTHTSSNIALSFLAYFYSCNYDVLKKIYQSTPMKRRTETYDRIKTSPPELLISLQKYLFIQ